MQQDETKSIVPKRLSYSYNFEKYIQSYLPSFSRDDLEKYNLYSNKNAKYLFYKLNDWMESMKETSYSLHGKKKKKDYFSSKSTGKRERQFLIEKIIQSIEFKNHYHNSIEKKPEIIETTENNYKVNRCVYQSLFSDITGSIFDYIHSLGPDERQEPDSDLKANGWGV